jgi:uncharacterized protein YPO0396
MEIYNWGTFDKKVFRINPQGNNSLLTGANASGKSTLIDALLTLLVPLKKDRFYNQSSGTERKGDRTEESYFYGNYGNQQQDGAASTTTLRLRDKKNYSVILASFTNTDQRIVTIFQVRYFVNDELKTVFGLSREQLEISKDFSNFDNRGMWKKLLEKRYNANSTKKRIEFFSGPTEYGERIWNLFGMRSAKGLTLFNQIVGVKVLDDLDNFIRTNMLEDRDAENEYIQLKENFQTLMEAKVNIDKTKEQIAQLQPIDEIVNKLTEIQDSLDKLQQSKKMAVYWFAKKGVELAEKELEKCNSDLEILKEELGKLREKEENLKSEERKLSIAIETDAVGSQIKDIEREIRGFETSRDNRKRKLDEYNRIAQRVKFAENPNENTFTENRGIAKNKKTELEEVLSEKNGEYWKQKNRCDVELKEQIEGRIETIKSLQENKNNIPKESSDIRERIIRAVGATAEEIPFIGELIRVKDDEKAWELSIEKILHNFALRLIVPEKYYAQVNKFVNANDLKGRIVYQRYQDFTSLRTMSNWQLNKNCLLNKIEFKPKNIYTEWLEDVIYNNSNYACVNDLQEFNRYEERAVTKEGLIKSVKGKHEKDDRPHILRKENYVLGWDNKEKIRLIQKEVKDLQDEQKEVVKLIREIDKSIKDTNALKDDFFKLFETYTKFDDIDWQSYAKTIQEKTEQKTKLEATNDKVKELQKQLEQVQQDLKQVSETDIVNKNRTIFQTEQKQKDIEKICTDNNSLLNQIGEVDVTFFEQENTDILNIIFANIEAKQSDFQNKNTEETEIQKEQKTKNETYMAKLKNLDTQWNDYKVNKNINT